MINTIHKLYMLDTLNIINISNPELLKEYLKCKMFVLQNCYACSWNLPDSDMWQQSGIFNSYMNTTQEVKQSPIEYSVYSLHLNPALRRANIDSRVNKHFLQLLVNRESLAQLKNITAPLCSLHMSLWQ